MISRMSYGPAAFALLAACAARNGPRDDRRVDDVDLSVTARALDPNAPANAPEFARASVQIVEPRDGYTIPDGSASVVFNVENYVLAPGGPHLHVILDDAKTFEHFDPTPVPLPPLSDGRHTVKAVLVRPNHEPVQAPRAAASSAFTVAAGKASVAMLQ